MNKLIFLLFILTFGSYSLAEDSFDQCESVADEKNDRCFEHCKNKRDSRKEKGIPEYDDAYGNGVAKINICFNQCSRTKRKDIDFCWDRHR